MSAPILQCGDKIIINVGTHDLIETADIIRAFADLGIIVTHASGGHGRNDGSRIEVVAIIREGAVA